MDRKEFQDAAAASVEKTDELLEDMLAGLCSVCYRPITLTNGFLSFARLHEGKINHPSLYKYKYIQKEEQTISKVFEIWANNPDPEPPIYEGKPIAYFAHANCDPDVYWFAIERLKNIDSEYGILNHIERKPWGSHVFHQAIKIGSTLREKLESPPTKSRSRNASGGLRAKVFERDNFKCRRCGDGPPEARLRLDHIVPFVKGGETILENLQTLCHPCNSSKSDRDPTSHDLVITFGRQQ
jgi:hypothetical protein